ncbi:transposase [Streptomyces nigrescens]
MRDDLWGRVESLLPVRQQRLRKLGRPPLDDRGCLQGILFVLHTGIQWEWLPQELGFGSGMTGWRRPRDWHEARGMEPVAPGAAIELHRVGELVWSPGGGGIDGLHRQGRRGVPKRGRARSPFVATP